MNRETGQSPVMGELSSESSRTESRSRRRRSRGKRWLGLALGALSLAAVAGLVAVPLLGSPERFLPSFGKTNLPTYKAAIAKLPIVVEAPGDLESAENLSVTCEVEGSSTVLFVKAQGETVKKGELVCELASNTLRDSLTNQLITTKQALSALEQVVKTREVAEIAVTEYLEGDYPQLEQNAKSNIGISKTELLNMEKQLEWSEKMMLLGYVTESQNRSDALKFQRAELSLSMNETSLMVLRKYTKLKQLTNLEASVARAKSDEFAKQAVYNLELEKEKKLQDQLEKCKMYAPGDGIVVYANEVRGRGPATTATMIEEGATIRERQVILSLPNIDKMRVKARVDESMIARVRKGEKARIKVDSVPNQVFDGTVASVAILADSRQLSEFDIRVYDTMVTFDNPSTLLRPGMTAQVEILVRQSAEALVIPVQTVVQFSGKDHVYVSTPKGPQRREVKVGEISNKLIEVVEGLEKGQEVLMNPIAAMSEAERQEVFVVSSLNQVDEGWDEILAKKPRAAQEPAPEAEKPE